MTRSHQVPQTREKAREYLLTWEHVSASSLHGELYTCEHDHPQCSLDPGGACLDEILQAYPGVEEETGWLEDPPERN
jgi:hypothetical protein